MRSFDIGMFRWLERGRRSHGVLLMQLMQYMIIIIFNIIEQGGALVQD